MAGPLKIFMWMLVVSLAVAWWYRDDLKQRWAGAEATKTRLYQWKNSEGNTSYSDRAESTGAGVVVVDTSRITPLEPVQPQSEVSRELSLRESGREVHAPTGISDRAGGLGAGGSSSWIKPLGPTKAPPATGDLSLQEFGREMQAKQLEFREKRMQAILDGKTQDPRR